MVFLSFWFVQLWAALAHAKVPCYPAGPIIPAPRNLAASCIFNEAVNNLSKAYDNAVTGSLNVSWPVENVSFSVAVVSLHQTEAHVPIWEYHHLAEGNTRGTQKLDRDSQWLIGSISKVFTDYLMLRSGIDTDKSVVEYLPGLRNMSSKISWDDSTLRMLGSHMAGVTADYGFSDYYILKDVFTSLGFPPLNDSDYPSCGVLGLNGGCGIQDYLQGVSDSRPVTAVHERPAYSNAAFNIIGIVLERFTGKNYTELIAEYVTAELNMSSTYPSPGLDDRGVIPPGESSWGSDYGLNTPAGGLVSTISDLSTFAHGLLSDSLALAPAQTRAWLKPLAFAEGPYTSVGMPWEISRLSDLTLEHPHPITMYGKSGGAQSYRSQLSVFPEYGVALIVLTAGSMHALPSIHDSAVGGILRAVDALARNQAEVDYVHSFSTDKCQGAGMAVEKERGIRLVIEQDADSLILGSRTMTKGENRSSELVDAMLKIWDLTIAAYSGQTLGSTIRLFPTAVSFDKLLPGGKTPVRGEVWRLWPDLSTSPSALPNGEMGLPDAGLVSGRECMTWAVGDWVHYGREPLDRIVFYRDEEGDVVGAELPFLRSGVMCKE